MKKIKLYAYWPTNLGDDLMVHILLNRYPQYRFYCEEWNPCSDMFNCYPNFINAAGIQKKYGRINHLLNILTLYRKKDFFINRVQNYYSESDAAIYIGGSVYMQNPNETTEARIRYENNKLNRNSLFVIGANFGPYYTDEFKNAFAAYFRKCGGVTFRDKASYELFPNNDKISYAPDVVFNLNVPSNLENNQTVLISVIDIAERKAICEWADCYYMRMAQICELCIQEGKTPVLMSFCKAEGDETAIQKILERISDDNCSKVETFLYNGNIDAVLELYRTADRVIATRFHAMILALKFRKPVYSISYNQKVKHVLQDMSLHCYCELRDLEHLSAKDILNGCATADVEKYTQMAEQQFAKFENYIGAVK